MKDARQTINAAVRHQRFGLPFVLTGTTMAGERRKPNRASGAQNAAASVSDFEGNTISIIDVDLAHAGNPNAEVARVRVGTDDPNSQNTAFHTCVDPGRTRDYRGESSIEQCVNRQRATSAGP